MYRRYFKRGLDIVAAFFGLIILSPFLLVMTVLLLAINRGRPFFIQNRPGKDEKEIKIVKFKTMNDKKNEAGALLPNHLRITAIGRFLRTTSLDELPQLINVLKGEMSLIGPRPLLFKYLPLYTEEQRKRHEVRPGITGWAQVNGRNAISWKQKFEYDIWYVKNLSWALDLKIVWLTIIKILKREGVNRAGGVTMPPFDGTN